MSLHLDVETGAASTTAGSQRVVHNLELGPDQLHCKIHLASLEEVERWLVEDNLRSLLRCGGQVCVVGQVLEDGVVFVDGVGPFGSVFWRQSNKTHEVLEAVATATLDLNAQGKVGVAVLVHDLGEALLIVNCIFGNESRRADLRCTGGNLQHHLISILILLGIQYASGLLPGGGG